MVTRQVDIGKKIDGVLYRWIGAFANRKDALAYIKYVRKKGGPSRNAPNGSHFVFYSFDEFLFYLVSLIFFFVCIYC